MSNPVTVQFTRHADPGRREDVMKWLEQGLRMAEACPGCIGTGLTRDSDDDTVLHAMCEFEDEQALAEWERSEDRQLWLDSGAAFVSDPQIQRRTGIEGWFDGPRMAEQVDRATGDTTRIAVRSAPLRWKQTVAILIGMYPANLALSFVISTLPWWSELPIPVRVAIQVIVLAPLMTFVMMPAVTRIMRGWLTRHPGLIRTQQHLLDALDSLDPVENARKANGEGERGTT